MRDYTADHKCQLCQREAQHHRSLDALCPPPESVPFPSYPEDDHLTPGLAAFDAAVSAYWERSPGTKFVPNRN